MKRYSSTTAAVVAVIVALAAFLTISIVASINHTDRWNEWARDCNQAGGLVSQVSTNRVECFIDGDLVTLPGWENE